MRQRPEARSPKEHTPTAFALIPFAVVPVVVTMLVFGRDQTVATAVSCVGGAWFVNVCLLFAFLAAISADGT